jgi:hypothetical protein
MHEPEDNPEQEGEDVGLEVDGEDSEDSEEGGIERSAENNNHDHENFSTTVTSYVSQTLINRATADNWLFSRLTGSNARKIVDDDGNEDMHHFRRICIICMDDGSIFVTQGMQLPAIDVFFVRQFISAHDFRVIADTENYGQMSQEMSHSRWTR